MTGVTGRDMLKDQALDTRREAGCKVVTTQLAEYASGSFLL